MTRTAQKESLAAVHPNPGLADDDRRRARRLAHRRRLSCLISFEHRDFTRTGFPDESFDVVWVVESVCHTPEKQSFMDEARRQSLGRRPVPNAVTSRR